MKILNKKLIITIVLFPIFASGTDNRLGTSGTTTNVQGTLNLTSPLALKETGGGSDTISMQAPASIAASYTLTWPIDDGTASQVLTTDGSGVLSWTTPAASGVTGSGTDKYVAFWNGTTAINFRELYFGGGTGSVFDFNVGTIGNSYVTMQMNIVAGAHGNGRVAQLNLMTDNGFATDPRFRITTSDNGTTNVNTVMEQVNSNSGTFTIQSGGLTTYFGGDIVATGDVAVNGGDLTTSAASFNLLNTNLTTGNINIGASLTTGDIMFANGAGSTGCEIEGTDGSLSCSGGLTTNSGVLISSAASANLFNTNATSINIGGAATGVIAIGNAAGALDSAAPIRPYKTVANPPVTPTEVATCNSTNEGYFYYRRDTSGANAGGFCVCATADGTTFAWVAGVPAPSACP